MQLVTAQLTERVEHLMDLAESNAGRRRTPLGGPSQQSMTATPVQTAAATVAADDAVAGTLGQLAMLLNNVELRDSFAAAEPVEAAAAGEVGGGQGRRGDGGGAAPGPPRRRPVRRRRPRPLVPRIRRPFRRQRRRRHQSAGHGDVGAGDRGTRTRRGAHRSAARHRRAGRGASPTTLLPSPAPGGPADPAGDAADHDRHAPIRREILRQYASRGRVHEAARSERQRIIGEVNQRMLGIAQGIRMGAAEAQRRVDRRAEGRVREGPRGRRDSRVRSPRRAAGAEARVRAAPAVAADGTQGDAVRQPARRHGRAQRPGRAAAQRRDQPAEPARHGLLDDAPRSRRGAVRRRARTAASTRRPKADQAGRRGARRRRAGRHAARHDVAAGLDRRDDEPIRPAPD